MTEVKLTAEEAGILRVALANLAVRARTGELGIIHGADRFVSTNTCLKKRHREVLNRLAVKLGLATGIRELSS